MSQFPTHELLAHQIRQANLFAERLRSIRREIDQLAVVVDAQIAALSAIKNQQTTIFDHVQ